MKMTKSIHGVLLISCLLAVSSCKKEEPRFIIYNGVMEVTINGEPISLETETEFEDPNQETFWVGATKERNEGPLLIWEQMGFSKVPFTMERHTLTSGRGRPNNLEPNGFYSTLEGGDVPSDIYDLDSAANNFVQITAFHEDVGVIVGEFEMTFLLDTQTHDFYEVPERLEFRDGHFAIPAHRGWIEQLKENQ